MHLICSEGRGYLRNYFDFSGIEKSEQTVQIIWAEFREALALGKLSYDDIESAKAQIFLKTYDDLFRNHLGILKITKKVRELKGIELGRGSILEPKEILTQDRLIPKKEFIKKDNRFSPPGVEWLYLSMGSDDVIHECSEKECKASKNQRFGFSHFLFDSKYDNSKIVDLSIVDSISYKEINQELENYAQKEYKKGLRVAKALGFIPGINRIEFTEQFKMWSVKTYTKLLSEQIFVPLDVKDNPHVMYAPFQCIAQYFMSLGYDGIIYGSTVCEKGKNIVLFDKKMASPIGDLEDYKIK